MDIFEAQISEMELQTAINNLKNKKSPGEDKIHPEFLKHAGTEAIKTILLRFQKIFETRHVPSMWRKAIAIPILKGKNDSKYTTNY